MRNYFKVSNLFFFFDDTDRASTERAYERASSHDTPVMCIPSPLLGPWSKGPIVGHRNISVIATDIDAAATSLGSFRLGKSATRTVASAKEQALTDHKSTLKEEMRTRNEYAQSRHVNCRALVAS